VIAVEPPSIVVAAIMGGMSDVPLWERSSTDREHFRGTFDADADACDRGWPVCPASVFDDVVELANLGPPAVDTLGPWNRTPRHGVVGMTPIVSGWKEQRWKRSSAELVASAAASSGSFLTAGIRAITPGVCATTAVGRAADASTIRSERPGRPTTGSGAASRPGRDIVRVSYWRPEPPDLRL
jgi:hypothetical protein